MNRLVIIGNGFDLAHGLPTSYRDFIDDFWRNFKDKNNTREYQEILNVSYLHHAYYTVYDEIKNFTDFLSNLTRYCQNEKFTFDKFNLKAFSGPATGKIEHIFYFKNDFFRIICNNSIENWVDVENEYYRELKMIVKSTSKSLSEKEFDMKKLNKEFKEIKSLLEVYLSNVFAENYDFLKLRKNEIISHLKLDPNSRDFLFDKSDKEYYENLDNLKLKRNLLLSFNYTKTVLDYSNYLLNQKMDVDYNYIHGKINTVELPMIFGFGDEIDEDYKEIENIDNNEYLKFFKSIQYLEHSNYKFLYNFIEGEPYQVYIFGHSCGLSDRTLLSTIFENVNCLSIKVFYYEKEDGSDNYTEIIQNISRHFNDKKMLRKKVVEKRKSEPLLKWKK